MDNKQGLKPGVTLRNGTYRIESVLGQGGFGITYLATDLTLDRKVAVKEFFMKDYCERDEDTSHVTLGTRSAEEQVTKLKGKFLKEARNIAKFDNPDIIRIFAAFEENNTAYYVMEYIDGVSLSAMVKRDGAMSPERALYYIGKVGDALDFVHSHRMTHLDVKPANIMVRMADDTPVLIDFGLSKRYDSEGHETSTSPMAVSPGFAPVEQYANSGLSEFSPQTDLYSLAATLYYLLTAQVPPHAANLIDEELSFPDFIPADLIAPIRKAMAPTRFNRQKSVREFLDAINAGDNGGRIKEAYSTKDETYASDDPGHGKVMKWLLSIVAVAAIAGGLFWWSTRDNGESAAATEHTQPEMVSNMYWESPLGTAAYTGEVMEDASGSKIPHGKGFARIVGGKYDGNIYDGEFVEGRMEGHTRYKMKNGDVFEGTFLNNKYEKGTYTVKENGDYFKGTFKDGKPDKGHWYNWKGKRTE